MYLLLQVRLRHGCMKMAFLPCPTCCDALSLLTGVWPGPSAAPDVTITATRVERHLTETGHAQKRFRVGKADSSSSPILQMTLPNIEKYF